MKITVKVTEAHIKGAWPGHESRCPIARAIRPFIKRGVEFRVKAHKLILGGKISRSLPARVTSFICDVDFHSGKAAPFSFNMDLPASVLVS